MQIVSSYGVEMKKKNIPLRATLDIFYKNCASNSSLLQYIYGQSPYFQ